MIFWFKHGEIQKLLLLDFTSSIIKNSVCGFLRKTYFLSETRSFLKNGNFQELQLKQCLEFFSLRFSIWFRRLSWSSYKIIFWNKSTSFWKTVLFLDLSYSTSLLTIPYLLRENAEDVFDFEGASLPRIQYDKPSVDINVISEENTSYHIMLQRFRLTSTKDFIKAFVVLMASFYVCSVSST